VKGRLYVHTDGLFTDCKYLLMSNKLVDTSFIEDIRDDPL